jgi:hypothetical protein
METGMNPQALAERLSRALAAAVLLAATALPASAGFDFAGDKALVAHTADGARLRLGTVSFRPAADGAVAFKIDWQAGVMNDHFLSMREFKCLPGAKEISCHVPYPYAQPGTVRPGQLAWLEHSLLFFTKTPAEFGARLWNGLYYEFQEEGNALVGAPRAVDLNQIGAPPANLAVPPFSPAQRHETPVAQRWLQGLRIE